MAVDREKNNGNINPKRDRKSDAKKKCSNMCKRRQNDLRHRSEKGIQNFRKEVGRGSAKLPLPRGLMGLGKDEHISFVRVN